MNTSTENNLNISGVSSDNTSRGKNEVSVPKTDPSNHSKNIPATQTAIADSNAGPDSASKHLLNSEWTFWYDSKKNVIRSKKHDYKEFKMHENSLQKIGSFKTVEDFWRYYIHLKRPSQIDYVIDFFMFRGQEKPCWENYPYGGFWILKLEKNKGVVGKAWQDLLFASVGEQFGTTELVGIMLSLRKDYDYISIWLKNNDNEYFKYKIAEKIKLLFSLESTTVLEFKTTKECMKDMSTFRNTTSFVLK